MFERSKFKKKGEYFIPLLWLMLAKNSSNCIYIYIDLFDSKRINK